MNEWLIRRFVKNHDDVGNPAVRTAYGKLASITGILCNALLSAAKAAIGLITGSISIVADAMNNLSDASSNIIALLGFKLASRPADDEHPYGHGRFEYLSGLAVAVMIVVIGIELLRSSIDKIANPDPADFSFVAVGILLMSIAVKLWMAVFNKKIGTRISSTTLLATAADSRNDVIATAAVLICAIISAATDFDLDGWAGLAVSAFIIYSGITLVKDATDPLLGRAPDPDLVEHVRNKIMSYPGVLGMHDLIIHDYGPGRGFASAHVEMPAEMDPLASHDTIDNIEKALLEDDNLLISLHYDPIVTADGSAAEMRTWLAEAVAGIDERLSVHDVRLVPGPTHTNVIFDCVRPHSFDMPESQIKARICDLMAQHDPTAVCVITVEESYV